MKNKQNKYLNAIYNSKHVPNLYPFLFLMFTKYRAEASIPN